MSYPPTIEEVRAEETRAYENMVARRNVGLRITVGIVAFDLLILKLVLEAADHTDDSGALSLGLGLIASFALITMAGMLFQIEQRNREDRFVYYYAGDRVKAIREGKDPDDVPEPRETLRMTIWRSWASTWPLLGTAALTVGILVMACQFSEPRSDPPPAPEHVLIR